MNNLPFFLFVIFISFLFTELIRRYTLKINHLDMPNERSSHSIATPRGGGLSIVVIFLTGVGLSDLLSTNTVIALIGSGTLVAGIGFWDDQGHIAARWRLLSHFIAAFWALFWLGSISEFQFFGSTLNTSWIILGISMFALVWLLNLFNFMDGIDGIEASETIFVSCAGAYFSWITELESLSFISLLLAASTMGFLILNWSPAKIFMGDVGSGFLGLMIGVIAFASILEGISVWIWLILLAVFLVDSGVTLLIRILNGEKWYEAHCSHAYQHAARKWGHKRVTTGVIIIDIFWLFPLAIVSQTIPEVALWCIFLAYIPLFILALKFKAGINE